MKKLTSLVSFAWTATAMVLVLVGAPMVVPAHVATNVFCNENIMQSTKLDGDLTCPVNALRIEADNVTLDLNGFTITGDSGPFPFEGAGVFVGDRTGVTIKNGTIQNFRHGVSANNPLNLTVSDLIFNDNQTSVLINVGGEDVVIRNSTFLFPASSNCDTEFREAIHFDGTTNVDVDNVDIHGGTAGVLAGCGECDGTLPPTNGKIRNSTFTGTRFAVFIANTTDLTISNNHFSNFVPTGSCEFGVGIFSLSSSPLHPRTGTKIRDNFIHDYTTGIDLRSVVAGAEINGNIIRDNSFSGISLRDTSTNNVIKDNITFGNGEGSSEIDAVDLFHDGTSFPNTWKDNSCETQFGDVGDDIPAC